ncbi:MAG: DOMON-like domain-containing protein [Pseudomonadota bacterium]|nr:DOMON-like domain-containing protein [Pseudomonadota bacterium]
MSWALQRHPESRGGADLAVEVELARPQPSSLRLRYAVLGQIAGLRLPPAAPPERTDGLWRSTCFEAFLRGPHGGYFEFNFAPSSQWAAYAFQDYRAGMAPVEPFERPRMERRAQACRYELDVELALDRLLDRPGAAPWRVGLSAVLEDAAGGISYWALSHPPGKPDFHHPDSFALDLPATEPR